MVECAVENVTPQVELFRELRGRSSAKTLLATTRGNKHAMTQRVTE